MKKRRSDPSLSASDVSMSESAMGTTKLGQLPDVLSVHSFGFLADDGTFRPDQVYHDGIEQKLNIYI